MKIKKILAATLAATMVMASALTVCATTDNQGSGSSSSSSSSSESVSAPTYAEEKSEAANAAVTVGGVAVKTSVAGVYAAEKVQGCAVTTSAAETIAALGLKNGQTPAIIIYDTDQKKSSAAMVSIQAGIDSIGGGEMVAALNVDLGARQNGKWVTLKDGNIAMKTGLPKNADTTKTYCIVCVQPGGVVTILEDQDLDPNTVTFAVQAGLGTYALVAK